MWLQIVSMGRKKFSADFQLMFRLLKLLLFIGFISTLVVFFVFLHLTAGDIFVCLLAFFPTGWAFLLVCPPPPKKSIQICGLHPDRPIQLILHATSAAYYILCYYIFHQHKSTIELSNFLLML